MDEKHHHHKHDHHSHEEHSHKHDHHHAHDHSHGHGAHDEHNHGHDHGHVIHDHGHHHHHHSHEEHHHHDHQHESTAAVADSAEDQRTRFIYALLSSLFISLLSFAGGICIMIGMSNSSSGSFFLIRLWLSALAVGSVFGDTVFHLLPTIFSSGGHDHSHDHSHDHNHGGHSHSHHTKEGLFLILGFFICFIIELYLRLRQKAAAATKGHKHHHHHHSHGASVDGEIKPFGWLNLIGDGIHNFMDGISLFSTYHHNLKLGIANTLCIIAHEIPQELSDFGVLLSAGFSVSKALLFNFLSGIVCVLGCLIGKFLVNFEANTMLLAITAGSFLYISCVDMIPELWNELLGDEQEAESSHQAEQTKKKKKNDDHKEEAPKKNTGRPATWKLLLVVFSGIAVGVLAMIGIGELEHYVVDYLSK